MTDRAVRYAVGLAIVILASMLIFGIARDMIRPAAGATAYPTWQECYFNAKHERLCATCWHHKGLKRCSGARRESQPSP